MEEEQETPNRDFVEDAADIDAGIVALRLEEGWIAITAITNNAKPKPMIWDKFSNFIIHLSSFCSVY